MTGPVTAAIAREVGAEPGTLERHDTLLSVVLLHRDRAFKFLRPVRFGFVDHRTLDARLMAQRAALLRNRPLAGDIYRAVRAVVPADGGFRLAAEGAPGAVDYVLEMRRFDDRNTLASRLDGNGVTAHDIDRIAERLCAFHSEARRVARPEEASPAAGRLARTIDENLDELVGMLPGAQDRVAVDRVRRRMHAFLRDDAELIAARNREGWIRELHGDLRAEHVLLDADRVRVVDAIEFSPELAEIDVADELAFLASDLEAHGARGVATDLLEAYRARGGDPGPPRLRAFYGAHRALVRSKVAALADHGGATAPGLVDARRRLALAERIAWRILGPRAYVICGTSGSGKSYLAAALAAASGLSVVASDRVRKQRAGLRATERAPGRLYDAESTTATYRELGERAAAALAAGEAIIVDATCLTRKHRADLLGAMHGFRRQAWFVRCEAPHEVLRQRVEVRGADPDRESDATVDVLGRQLALAEPLDELPAERVLSVRTDLPVDRILARLSALLDA